MQRSTEADRRRSCKDLPSSAPHCQRGYLDFNSPRLHAPPASQLDGRLLASGRPSVLTCTLGILRLKSYVKSPWRAGTNETCADPKVKAALKRLRVCESYVKSPWSAGTTRQVCTDYRQGQVADRPASGRPALWTCTLGIQSLKSYVKPVGPTSTVRQVCRPKI